MNNLNYERCGARHKKKFSENVRMKCNVIRMRDLNSTAQPRRNKWKLVKCGVIGKCSRLHGATEEQTKKFRKEY